MKAPRLASAGALADALGMDGVERRWFNRLCAGEEPELGREGRLPVPLTPLVGRASEVAALTELLSRGPAPLVTLTGVAGVGKSRLAMEVARRLQQQGRQTWWVPLASIGDVRYVLDAVARVVDAPTVSTAALAARLGRQEPLLALDNLEHLDGVGELVAELSRVVPSLTVLATSRAPVGIAGEQEWLLRPLPVPVDEEGDPAVLASVGSVQLLVERVRAVMPGFELTTANARAVGEICRLLDGLPLAVELAAKQWRVRGGAGLVRSIRRDPLGLHDISDSAAEEHACLRNALEASYALLDDPARHTFGCLSVFPAAWSVDAAAAVADSWTAVDHLDRLAALGLVVRSVADSAAEPRFSMLPTIRAFAATKAREAATAELASARQATYFRSWVVGATSAEHPHGTLLESERDNIRAALDWFRAHDPWAGLEMAAALYPHWYGQGRETEGLAYFDDLLAGVEEVHADASPLKARAQQQAASLAYGAGDYELACRFAARSLATYQDLDDPRGRAEALGTLGMASLVIDPQASVAHCQAAVAQVEPLGDVALLASLLDRLAVALSQLGRLDEATVVSERAQDVAVEHHLTGRQVRVMLVLHYILMVRGDWVAADQLLEAGAPLVASADEARLEAFWVARQAATKANLGDLDRASALVAAVTGSAAETGSAMLRTVADLALAELKLVEGASEEAAAALRSASARPSMLALPLNRMVWLAMFAVAAADAETAADAVCAAEQIARRYSIEIPVLVARRLDAARDRWVRAGGTRVWSDHIAAASPRALEDLLRDLADAPATSLARWSRSR